MSEDQLPRDDRCAARVLCRVVSLVVWAVALSACSSAPVRFLTLVPPPPESTDGVQPDSSPTLTVSVPSQVDQPELVARQPDGSMAPLESERWIAPLSDEIRAALVLALQRQWAAAAWPPARIRVQVQRFDSAPDRYALIEAVWTISLDTAPKRSVSCRSTLRQSVGSGYPALAAGHRAALQDLAAQMLQAARALAASPVSPAAPAPSSSPTSPSYPAGDSAACSTP